MLSKSKPIAFVATSNPTKAREFYQRVLGLRCVSSDQYALVFDARGTMLRVQIVNAVNPHQYTSLGWEVFDIKKEIGALTGQGVRFERYEGMGQDEDGIWTSPSGGRIAWFKDPDDNILSLTQFMSRRVRTSGRRQRATQKRRRK